MTEEEKRRIAQAIIEETMNRPASVFDIHTERIKASIRRAEQRQQLKASLSQQGITWEQLRDAYETAFSAAHADMIDHHLSYFYAGIAIAFKEAKEEATPEDVAAFVKAVFKMPEEMTDRAAVIQKSLEQTGVDVSQYDEEVSRTPSRATMTTNIASRKDREAVKRMKATGITAADLAYERDLGYRNGWNSGFNFSICYGAAAIILSRQYEFRTDAIERFIERLEELRYEEISTENILERARQEAGVDVSGLVKVKKFRLITGVNVSDNLQHARGHVDEWIVAEVKCPTA